MIGTIMGWVYTNQLYLLGIPMAILTALGLIFIIGAFRGYCKNGNNPNK